MILPTAEPFFFPGSSTRGPGCLLIHGFTGTPKEMRWMGEHLHTQGFAAMGIRLTGHATRPEDMIHANYGDWLACVEDGYHLLSGVAKHIYLMGLSMGGVLALGAAAVLPVRGVVAMSTPYKLVDDWRLNFIDLLALFQTYNPKSKEPPGASWFDQEAFQSHVSYPQNPVRSIGQLDKLEAHMRATLPQVKVPVLLIHSHDDPYVWKESMPSIHRDLGSTDKQMLWIEKSGHVITCDAQREAVFKAATDFVRRVERQPA